MTVQNAINAARTKAREHFADMEAGDPAGYMGRIKLVKKLESDIVRKAILKDGTRIDGRRTDQVRPIESQVHILPEGGAEPLALLGAARLVAWLAARKPFKSAPRVEIVLDCGTGATAAGLALGIALLGLPAWRVRGVEVGGPPGAGPATAAALLRRAAEELDFDPGHARRAASAIDWEPRRRPRKFGRMLPGDAAAVRAVASAHGVVLDPLWTLAAWEAAEAQQDPGTLTALLHTGGPLALTAAAQRWPDLFAREMPQD